MLAWLISCNKVLSLQFVNLPNHIIGPHSVTKIWVVLVCSCSYFPTRIFLVAAHGLVPCANIFQCIHYDCQNRVKILHCTVKALHSSHGRDFLSWLYKCYHSENDVRELFHSALLANCFEFKALLHVEYHVIFVVHRQKS